MEEIIVLTPMDSVVLNGPLDHEQAMRELARAARQVLDWNQVTQKGYIWTYIKTPHVIASMIFAIILIIEVILSGSTPLIEGILILLVIICNGGLHVRECRLEAIEKWRRLDGVVKMIEKNRIIDEV